MSPAVERLLDEFGVHPVLVDIGASGSPPALWDALAHRSTYVGFDPDRRALEEIHNGRYRRAAVVNRAVTAEPGRGTVEFNLTASPYCSSTLEPNHAALAEYLFSDLFAVQDRVSVPATTLDAVVDDLSLDRIDWLKTDSQGTDLRLTMSLGDALRSQLMAVDIEPGLMDAYRGEDPFVDAHRALLAEGFWLSWMDVRGTVRMRRSSLAVLQDRAPGMDHERVKSLLRPSPGWCEARYLRTPAWLGRTGAEPRDHVLLWAIALLDGQPGFALDLALDYERRFGSGGAGVAMKKEAIDRIVETDRRRRAAARRPSARLKRWLWLARRRLRRTGRGR